MAKNVHLDPLTETETAAPPGPLKEFWRYFRENRGAVIGLWFFLLMIVVALSADVIAPHPPNQQYRDALLQPPVWQDGGSAKFLLGTDAVGRDMLSRLIYGARYSLFIGCIVVVIALSSGIVIGLIAGFSRGWIDTAIMRVMDIILAFPSLLLALVLVAILGPSLINAMIAIAIVLQPHYVRLTRAAVMGERGKDYVIAARVNGAKLPRLMFKTVLPNCTAPLIVRRCRSRPPSSTPRRSVFSASGRNRRRRNGALCWPKRASLYYAPGGW